MSLKLARKPPNKLKTTAITSAILIGTAYIVLQTFPHLKTSLSEYFYPTKNDDEPEITEEESIEVQAIVTESVVDIKQVKLNQSLSEWSNDDLKSWLIQVSIVIYLLKF